MAQHVEYDAEGGIFIRAAPSDVVPSGIAAAPVENMDATERALLPFLPLLADDYESDLTLTHRASGHVFRLHQAVLRLTLPEVLQAEAWAHLEDAKACLTAMRDFVVMLYAKPPTPPTAHDNRATDWLDLMLYAKQPIPDDAPDDRPTYWIDLFVLCYRFRFTEFGTHALPWLAHHAYRTMDALCAPQMVALLLSALEQHGASMESALLSLLVFPLQAQAHAILSAKLLQPLATACGKCDLYTHLVSLLTCALPRARTSTATAPGQTPSASERVGAVNPGATATWWIEASTNTLMFGNAPAGAGGPRLRAIDAGSDAFYALHEAPPSDKSAHAKAYERKLAEGAPSTAAMYASATATLARRAHALRWTARDGCPPADATQWTIASTARGRHGAELRVDGWLLYARWPYFRALVKSGLREATQRRMELPSDWPDDALLELVRYMHCADVSPKDLSLDGAHFLIHNAHELTIADETGCPTPAFEPLIAHCWSLLCPPMRIPTAVSSLMTRLQYASELDFEEAKEYVARHVPEIWSEASQVALLRRLEPAFLSEVLFYPK